MFAADQERWSAKSNARSGAIVRFIWHHQAGTSDDGTLAMMTTAGLKDVSATWTVDNKAPVGAGLRDYARITAVVPEERRPWTTASALDDGALTVECANSTGPDGDPPYSISDASFEACARLAAYAEAAYGVPLQRATAANGWRGHMGHKEAPDTYATACPMNLDIDRILDLASGGSLGGGALQPTTPPEADEDDAMKFRTMKSSAGPMIVAYNYAGMCVWVKTLETLAELRRSPGYDGHDDLGPDAFGVRLAAAEAARDGKGSIG